ncbi:YqaJ viral recombinase family protein [Caballeronia sp. KNU42]
MTERIAHDLAQGSDAWLEFRLTHFGASEAAAMLGLSKTVKRTELLHMKHTGTAKEFSDWVQENILDHGHEVEALARPIIEMSLGEDLYPMVFSLGKLSASCDGLTMLEDIAWENKQRNKSLHESIASGVLPIEHMPQAQQVLMVTGAARLIFSCSDGTELGTVTMEVLPDYSWFQRIRAGWSQFQKDLDEYVPVAAEIKPVGRTPETMPALRIEVTGMVTASNLQAYHAHAMEIFGNINRDLTTDQHFADAERTVKWCEEVETKLKAAKEHALSQTESIDALFKTIDDITAEARRVRLDLDKLVTKRKVEVKDGILLTAKAAYEKHIAGLKTETEGAWIALPPPDFAGSAKGKRTVASIQDGVDTVLANAKIAADASAKAIRASLTCLREDTAGFGFLFSDKLSLIGKPMDDLKLVIKTRIADHQAAEEKRREEDRARIQAEEEKKAEARVREQAAKEAAEAAVKAAQEAAAAKAAEQHAPIVTQPAPAPAIERTPTAVSRPAPTAHVDPVGLPTLRLGQINERLAPIALSADGLASLGFTHAATDKAAKLFHESSFPLICAALIRHIEAVSSDQKKAA